MAILHNDITINAPVEKIWEVLSTPEMLEKYDPTVLRSTMISTEKMGIGAKRKVHMRDGKNWFEERITVCQPNVTLTYELTNCSFPVSGLKHTYTFQQAGDQTKVIQVMEYKVKFGMFGKLLDALMIRGQSDKGIKLFFAGLKQFVESK